ncbi:MAG: metal ABC transporter ATP-binding protein, partial [Anaerolineales bacterium]|nr:metal ABC transporter ATP-binding protein [Anaerolineales bacterium]
EIHHPDAPALEVRGVSVRYNGSPALDNVDFVANRGEQIAIVGPNGAGKSTLFGAIVGTIRPNQGTVKVYGSGPGQHICIGYVPQRTKIDWRFPVTVDEVVMMGRVGKIGWLRAPGRHDRELVRSSLAQVGMTDLAHRQIGELSGGQQQRIFIARALAQRADLLLMDEPLSGLDIPSQRALFDILASLKPDGVTVLVATHDLNLAAERFDRVMLLNRQIIAFGPPDQVLTSANLLAAYGGQIHMETAGVR